MASVTFMVSKILTDIDHHALLSPSWGTQMKKLLIALFTVIAIVNVAGCAGKGKAPIVQTRG